MKQVKDRKTNVTEKDIQMTNKCMKRCTTSLVMREMKQINEVLKYICQND